MRTVIIIFLMILAGCATKSNDTSVTVVKNDLINEPYELNLNQIHVIDSTSISYPVSIRFGGNGDLYVLEYRSDNIKAFDGKDFQLKDSIFAPERTSISSFSYNDGKIIINCSGKKRLHIVDASEPENIIKTYELTDEIPNIIESLPEGNFFGLFNSNLSGRDETFLGYDLKMVDPGFKTIKLLNSFFGSYNQGNIDPEIPIFPFAIDRKNNSVFVAVSSEKYHRIFTYDTAMNLKFIINSNAESVKFNNTEKERLNDLTIRFRLAPFKSDKKTLIESMTTDSQGNLWVRKAHDAEKYGSDKAVIDVFDPEGKYLNTYFIPDIPRIGNFYINGNRILTTDPFESKITIYEFDLKQIGRVR
ncbi:MAG: hypothetical protein JXN63_06060 [Candidatus Delongbacteria bacterium]|nr:hypothetical protein [Candidatus Delongbacteria bacterium]